MPFIFQATVRHKVIFHSARQKFSIVLYGWHVAQHAFRDVRIVCELRRTQNLCRDVKTKFLLVENDNRPFMKIILTVLAMWKTGWIPLYQVNTALGLEPKVSHSIS